MLHDGCFLGVLCYAQVYLDISRRDRSISFSWFHHIDLVSGVWEGRRSRPDRAVSRLISARLVWERGCSFRQDGYRRPWIEVSFFPPLFGNWRRAGWVVVRAGIEGYCDWRASVCMAFFKLVFFFNSTATDGLMDHACMACMCVWQACLLGGGRRRLWMTDG